MNSLKCLLPCMIIFCVSSCRNNVPANSDVLYVDVDTEQQSPLSEFISSEKYICLETADSCLLSNANFLGFSDDKLIVENWSSFYVFGSDGRYISSFNHHGQGPGEYAGITGMRLYDGVIYVMDSNIKKIFEYSLEGELLKEINLDYNFVGFDVKSSDRIVLASGNINESMAEFVIIDSGTGETVAKICPYGICQTVTFWDYQPFCGKKDDDIFVNIPFSQCTYRLDDYNVDSIASYHFNTTVQLPELDLKSMDIAELIHSIQNTNVVRQLGLFYPSDSCNYLTYMLFGRYGIKHHLLKFDKQGNSLAQTILGLDIDKDFPYFGEIRSMIDGNIICVRNADELLGIDESLNRDYWKTQGLTEESNPVIFFYKLKEL